jgi:hypothetical protein
MRIKTFLITLLMTANAFGQDTLQFTPRGTDASSYDEFRYIGGAIACISKNVPDPESGYCNCLHFCDIKMRMTVEEIESILGKADTIIYQGKQQIRVYFLPTNENHLSYFAITFNNKIARSLQLTGFSTTENYAFSSIALGSDYKAVLEILGKPKGIYNVPDIKGVGWTYDPFPISIEFINRKVYSIRIEDNK